MSEGDYRIWSNADLDYEEWKDWMEEEYPTLSDDERVAMTVSYTHLLSRQERQGRSSV